MKASNKNLPHILAIEHLSRFYIFSRLGTLNDLIIVLTLLILNLPGHFIPLQAENCFRNFRLVVD